MVENRQEQKHLHCEENCNENCEQTSQHEIQFTFSEEALETFTAGSSSKNEQLICIYVEDIHVVVGAQETVIKLSP